MELISKRELLNAIVDKGQSSKRYKLGEKWELNGEELREAINSLPVVDGRIKGKWRITSAYPHNVYCSICNRRYAQTHWAVWNDPEMPLPRNFCPNCGAKMRGEEE